MQRLSLLLLLVFTTLPAFAQRVAPESQFTRYWVIDRLVTDAEGRRWPAHRQGMLGFVVIAYKGDLVLCEYTAARHSDFDALKSSTDSAIRWFDKSVTRKEHFRVAARAAGFAAADLDKLEKTLVRVR
jgi:hypothetical protein